MFVFLYTESDNLNFLNQEALKFTPVSSTCIRMEARILVPFKPANKDMKEVTSAEIIKDQVSSGIWYLKMVKNARF